MHVSVLDVPITRMLNKPDITQLPTEFNDTEITLKRSTIWQNVPYTIAENPQ